MNSVKGSRVDGLIGCIQGVEVEIRVYAVDLGYLVQYIYPNR